MDIQSFLLGMSVVLLIGSSVIGVIALVKVSKLKKTVEFNKSNRDSEMQNVYHEFERVRKSIDSRCDKLDNKFSQQTENIKE